MVNLAANFPAYTRSGPGEGNYSASILDQALLALWFYYTFIVRANNELVLYPLALYWTASFVIRHREMTPMALKSFLVFLLPVLAAVSWAWAAAPDTALRFGIMWGLSAVIAVYISVRFAPHEIIRSVFFAGLVTVVLVTPAMSNFGNHGPWGEKNIFAVRMVVIMLTAMAVAFNKYELKGLRLLAFPLIPVCYLYMVIAQSATSLVFGSVSVLAMVTVWLFWSRFSAIRHLRTSFFLILLTLALCIALWIASMPEFTYYEDVLDSLGKDTTLTGRTMLWDAADRIVQEKPLFGVGAESFWLWDHGQSYSLLEMSHKAAGTKFSFHNSYLEVQVHLGLVGLTLLWMLVVWCLYRTVITWFQTQTVIRSFFLLITAIVFISSFTESWLYSVFDTSVTLFYASAISSLMRQKSLKDEADREAWSDWLDSQEAGDGPALQGAQ